MIIEKNSDLFCIDIVLLIKAKQFNKLFNLENILKVNILIDGRYT